MDRVCMIVGFVVMFIGMKLLPDEMCINGARMLHWRDYTILTQNLLGHETIVWLDHDKAKPMTLSLNVYKIDPLRISGYRIGRLHYRRPMTRNYNL